MNSIANRDTGGGRTEMNDRHSTHHVRRSNKIIETLPRIIYVLSSYRIIPEALVLKRYSSGTLYMIRFGQL